MGSQDHPVWAVCEGFESEDLRFFSFVFFRVVLRAGAADYLVDVAVEFVGASLGLVLASRSVVQVSLALDVRVLEVVRPAAYLAGA